MRQELDKETLAKLYVQDKKSLSDIAKMTGWSRNGIRTKCIKYGIRRRSKTEHRKINIAKSLLQKLYVKEGKSVNDIAAILSQNSITVVRRLKEHKIPMRGGPIEGLTKRLLQKLYVKERRSTRGIGKLFGCSRNVVQRRCREYGIALRSIGRKEIRIDEETLRRLYVTNGKSIQKIAKKVGCCYSSIYKMVKRLGLDKERKKRKITNGKQ